MVSIGRSAYCEELFCTTIGSVSYPVHTIHRASTDIYHNDLSWVDADTGEVRLKLKEDGHLQIEKQIEFFSTPDVASGTKQFSIGLNDNGDTVVIRDEVNGVDVLTVDQNGPVNIPLSSISNLQSSLNAKQAMLTVNGQAINTEVLGSFQIAANGDGPNAANSLLTAKAVEDWFEILETRLCLVSPAEAGPALRVGTIATSGPSSVNIPSCNAVSKFFGTKQTQLGWSEATISTTIGIGPGSSVFYLSSLKLNKPLEIVVQQVVQSSTLTPLLLLRGPRDNGNPAMLFSTEANSMNDNNTHFDYANITPTTDAACGLQIGTYPFITTADQKRWRHIFLRATSDISLYANTYRLLDSTGGSGPVDIDLGMATITTQEMARLKGVTSDIQTQLHAKQPSGTYLTPSSFNDTTLTGTVDLPAATSVNLNATNLESYVDGRISSHEFGHVDIGSTLRLKNSTTYHSPALVATNNSNVFQKVVCSELVIAATPSDTGTALSTLLAAKLDLPHTGFSWPSHVTDTVLSYLDATSPIQGQIDSKQESGEYLLASSDVTFSGTVGIPADSRIGGQSFNTYVDGRIQGHSFSYVDVGSVRIQGSTASHSPALVATDTSNACIPLVCSELVVATDIHSSGSSLTSLLSTKHPNTTVDSTPIIANTSHLVSSAGVAAKFTSLSSVYHPLTTVDAVPTENNTTHLVSSHGVYSELSSKMPQTTIDDSVTPSSGNLVRSGAVHTAIQTSKTSLEALITALTVRVATLEASSTNVGFTQQRYQGYYNDNYTGYFIDSRKDGVSAVVTSIILGDEGSNYSYKWSAIFVPDQSGSWTFRTQSDDASHVLVGSSLVVNNGGTHGNDVKTGSINLTSGTSYDLRIYYGELSGGASMTFAYRVPGSNTYVSNLTSSMFTPA